MGRGDPEPRIEQRVGLDLEVLDTGGHEAVQMESAVEQAHIVLQDEEAVRDLRNRQTFQEVQLFGRRRLLGRIDRRELEIGGPERFDGIDDVLR